MGVEVVVEVAVEAVAVQRRQQHDRRSAAIRTNQVERGGCDEWHVACALRILYSMHIQLNGPAPVHTTYEVFIALQYVSAWLPPQGHNECRNKQTTMINEPMA